MALETIKIFLGTLAVFAAYFAPALIAHKRKHKNYAPIVIVNLFLGWTVLVWVICLAWAFSSNTRQEAAET